MKKALVLVAAVVCLALTSCTKTIVAQYGYDGTELKYAPGHDDEAQAFAEECQSTAARFDGTEFTETQFINAFEVVVNKYNHRYIQGPFKLFKDSQSNVIKTFYMTADL